MTLKMNADAVRDLLRSAEMRQTLREAGQQVAVEAAARAPRRTGAGARSIRADVVIVNGYPEARVSWDRDHFYMSFFEFGRRDIPAEPFLRPAAGMFQ